MNYPFLNKYRARCIKVIDGDTIDVVIDMGFKLTATMRLRLWGINTPELHAKEPLARELAARAKDHVVGVMMQGPAEDWSLRIETLKDPDVFGRYLAKIWYTPPAGAEVFLNDELVAAGLASDFMR